MDTPALITKVKSGDKLAFAKIVRHYERSVFGFLGRMGLTQAHAEDVAQEVFLRAWRSLDRFDPLQADFSTWLFTLARNVTLNEFARASFRHETTIDHDVLEPLDVRTEPLTTLLANERIDHLRAALLQLPLADRSALALAYVNGLNIASIATIEGCAIGAIKTRLHRARQNLRHQMENDDD